MQRFHVFDIERQIITENSPGALDFHINWGLKWIEVEVNAWNVKITLKSSTIQLCFSIINHRRLMKKNDIVIELTYAEKIFIAFVE